MSRSKKQTFSNEDDDFSEQEEDEEEEYEVEKILKVRVNPKTKKKEYLVKWANWPMESSTWEPESNLKNVRDIVDEFEGQQRIRGHQILEAIPPQSHTKKPHSQQSHSTTKKSQNYHQTETKKEQHSIRNNSERHKPFDQFDDYGLFAQDYDKTHTQSKATSDQKQGIHIPERLSQFEQSILDQYANGSTVMSEQVAVPVPQNKTNQQLEEATQEYVFDRIVDKRFFNGMAEYLVSFQGLSASQWVQEADLLDFALEIQQFNESATTAASTDLQQSEEDLAFQKKSNKIDVNSLGFSAGEDQAKKTTANLLLTPPKDQGGDSGSTTEKLKSLRGRRLLVDDDEDDDDDDGDRRDHSRISELNQQRQKEDSKKKSKKSKNRLDSDQQIEEEGDNEDQVGSKQKKGEGSSKKKQSSNEMRKRQKRVTSEFTSSMEAEGDFKTDNVDSMTILGEKLDLLSSQVQVAWKPRDGGKNALPTTYSISFVRRHEPDLLIEHLMHVIATLLPK